MDVIIHGNNLKLSDNLKEYAQSRLGKLDRYLPNIYEIRLDLSRQNTKRGEDWTIAQITLRHSRGAILRAEEKVRGEDHDTVQAAINTAVDKMYRRIDRFKGKRSRKGRSSYKDWADGRFVATPEELEMAEEVPDFDVIAEEYALDEEFAEGEIIRRKEVAVPPMNEGEAIEQMELLGHNFFMFLNGETGKINVLYRRANGGYGVLVPQ